jgi:hypothetical protein
MYCKQIFANWFKYFEVMYCIYKTNLRTYRIQNNAASVPVTCFGHYITIVREYNIASYPKHVVLPDDRAVIAKYVGGTQIVLLCALCLHMLSL